MLSSITRFFAAWTVLIVLVVTTTEADGERHCGRDLMNIMQFLCKGKFQGMTGPSKKRANTGELVFDFQRVDHPRFRRNYLWYIEGAIVNECCNNPCSVDTMMTYCKPA